MALTRKLRTAQQAEGSAPHCPAAERPTALQLSSWGQGSFYLPSDTARGCEELELGKPRGELSWSGSTEVTAGDSSQRLMAELKANLGMFSFLSPLVFCVLLSCLCYLFWSPLLSSLFSLLVGLSGDAGKEAASFLLIDHVFYLVKFVLTVLSYC